MFKRRIVFVTLITGLLLGLAGCGDSKNGVSDLSAESVYENTISEDNSAYTFERDESVPVIGVVSGFCLSGGAIYTYHYFNDNELLLLKVNQDSNELRCLAKAVLNKGEYVSMMVPATDDRVGFVVTDDKQYRLIEYDGYNMINKGDISSIFSSKSGIVLEMYHVKNGYVAVKDTKIIAYDEDFEKTSQVDSKIGCSCIDKNGNVVVAYNERENDSTDMSAMTNVISVFDVEAGEITDKYETRLGEMTDVSTGSGDNDIYIYADDVYGLNYTNKTQKKVMSIASSGFASYGHVFEFLDERTLYETDYTYVVDGMVDCLTLTRHKLKRGEY